MTRQEERAAAIRKAVSDEMLAMRDLGVPTTDGIARLVVAGVAASSALDRAERAGRRPERIAALLKLMPDSAPIPRSPREIAEFVLGLYDAIQAADAGAST